MILTLITIGIIIVFIVTVSLIWHYQRQLKKIRREYDSAKQGGAVEPSRDAETIGPSFTAESIVNGDDESAGQSILQDETIEPTSGITEDTK